MHRRAIATVGVLVFALSGCANEAELPKATAATETARPALTVTRFEQVQSNIFDSLASADEELNGEALAERVTGPFASMRNAEYKLKSILADSMSLERLSDSADQTMISAADDYPHAAVSIMAEPAGSSAKTIDVFVQPSARENWSLWGVADILPGATVPALKFGEEGGTVLASDSAEGLVASPDDVLAGYTTLASTRTDSKGLRFADDAWLAKMAEAQDANAETTADTGTATMSFEPGENGTIAVRTADGGALVFGQVNVTTTISVTAEGGSVDIAGGGNIAALGTGNANDSLTVTDTMTAHYTTVIVFNVPAADAEDQTIDVVAAHAAVLLDVSNG